MEEEIWKSIKGYEGLYEISNLGRIKSLNYNRTGKEKIIKPQKNKKNGYLQVNLYRNGKRKYSLIHRLVATAFLPNPLELPEVNHKDENPSNNIVGNIEWCDRRYNINYGSRIERTSKPVEASMFSDFREICLRFSSTAEAKRNDFTKSAVAACCRGCYCREGNNKYRGLYWRFAS